MKLELKHLAPYLPYGLKATYVNALDYHLLVSVEGADQTHWSEGKRGGVIERLKPHLRPLSDLTNEIEHNGELFIPAKHASSSIAGETVLHNLCAKGRCDMLQGWQLNKLHEWHFDTQGLIEAGLAVDLNTLEG